MVHCESVKCEGTACDITDFEVPYDHLLVAVGATTNTFGIPGKLWNIIILLNVYIQIYSTYLSTAECIYIYVHMKYRYAVFITIQL